MARGQACSSIALIVTSLAVPSAIAFTQIPSDAEIRTILAERLFSPDLGNLSAIVPQNMVPFQLQRLGIIMKPEPRDPNEVEGVLNPAAARGPDGRLYLFPRLVARGNFSRIGIARVNFDSDGDPVGAERLGIALEPEADYELRPGGGGTDPDRSRPPARRIGGTRRSPRMAPSPCGRRPGPRGPIPCSWPSPRTGIACRPT